MLYLTSVIEMDSTNTGLQSDDSFIPDEVCSLLSFNYFDKVISKFMIPAFIKKSSRARIGMMVEALKKSYEKRIITLGWLDRQTKEQALKKVCIFLPAIAYIYAKIALGYWPQYWLPFLPREPNSWLQNISQCQNPPSRFLSQPS